MRSILTLVAKSERVHVYMPAGRASMQGSIASGVRGNVVDERASFVCVLYILRTKCNLILCEGCGLRSAGGAAPPLACIADPPA